LEKTVKTSIESPFTDVPLVRAASQFNVVPPAEGGKNAAPYTQNEPWEEEKGGLFVGIV
jgi:LAS superfamily LD-carboxypeptidase LdcB